MRYSIFAVVCGLVLAAIVVPVPHGLRTSLADDKKPVPVAIGEKAGQEWSGNDLKMKFCWCPPGKFTMGSPEDEPGRFPKEHDEDQAQVTLTKGFWLAKHEVTQGEWQRVMGTTVAQQRDEADKRKKNKQPTPLQGEGDAFPIYFVSHGHAVEFCEKLTKSERAAERLPAGWEYRLPTEAQWEYACRAGTTTATAFGPKLSSKQANFDGSAPYNGAEPGDNKKSTVAVGSYPPNAWGLCDMHGNVSEWCRDTYAEKLPGGTDPEVVLKDSRRVLRGGNWGEGGAFCRSAFRGQDIGTYRDEYQGFRIALVQYSE